MNRETHIKVKCPRCDGLGEVVHRTARWNATCFCCGGSKFIYRKRPTKRLTAAERLALFNERVAAGLDPNTGEPLPAWVAESCKSNRA